MNEASLIHQLKKNRHEVLETLYDTYAPVLFTISLRYCKNRPDAEDVLHESFIKIIRHIHTFKKRSSGSFEGWMKRILVNTALNFLRDQSKERGFLDLDKQYESIPSEEESADSWDPVPDHLRKETIMELIHELPPGYRAVFNLYVFEEYSHKEIAAMLHCSESTSKSQLSKARAILRKKIMATHATQTITL